MVETKKFTLYLNKRVNITHGEHALSLENSSKTNEKGIKLIIIPSEFSSHGDLYECYSDGMLVKVGEVYL